MRTIAIVQARMGSTRFPRKVMMPILGTPMIGLLIRRLRMSRGIEEVVLATSLDGANDPLEHYAQSLACPTYRGSEHDVLDRFYQAATRARAEVIIRITGDCPLVDPLLVDQVIDMLRARKADYVCNTMPPTFPDGLDVEAFTMEALRTSWESAKLATQREHVTPYIRESGLFKVTSVSNDADCSAERWTVDEPDDFRVVEAVFAHFHPRWDFSWREVLQLRSLRPELFAPNRHLTRNEGATMGAGQKLWKRARRVIPGGNMLLSKRAEMFLPEQWPAYFSKARGCTVWDLDGREYRDLSIMGVGTNILGYGHPEVDEAVQRTVSAGNMTTLNCPEEVYLAEKLVELHPWAEMARFARSGGEANAVAIRIARAATGKEKVAICGYHGWHDWYLAANLGDERNLAGHLLPGLEPRGVPEELRGTVLPFNYNRFDELQAIVDQHSDVGVIMMEVSRSHGPVGGFLAQVRELASRRGIVLIFDECTSGFRQSYGGLHKIYGVEPDMAMFGKALGNGYAITGAIGRREVMEAAQSTFISSTFWTERIGPTAALKTLEVMGRVQSWEQITRTGEEITARWKVLARQHGLTITTHGLPSLTGYAFSSPNALAYKTLVTQEMLIKGYLATTSVYVCTEHTPQVVDDYFAALDPIFALIRECEDGRDVMTLLKGPICHAGFKRLN